MPKIDFSTCPATIDTEYAGEVREIDAVSLEIIPEKSMTDDTTLVHYAVYFGTPNGIESSRIFARGEPIKVDLWSDLTESEVLECQLIASNSDGSKISKSPIVRFVLGESLEGELIGADDRHDSLIAQIADLELKKHWHDNKTVLDKFSESADGSPTYNGNPVGGAIEIYNSSTGKSKYSLEELAQFYNSKIPLMYQGHFLTVFSASTLLLKAYYLNPVNHTVKKFDVKPDKSFFWYADVVLADNSALQNEATQRQANDNALSSRIDAVIARSDVVDVVGTYADLEEYDTDTLGDNDLIKVLKDETRDNTRTYYRWHTATNDFTFVGLEETSKIVEIAESTGQAALYTSNELYEMKLEGKIFSYRGIILSDVQAGRYSFNASYTEVMSGKVIVVSQVGNNLPIFITTEVVGVNPQGGGTDYGIMFYLGNDGKLYFERNDL